MITLIALEGNMIVADLSSCIEKGQTFIIAEIGQNHQGEIENAKKLIKVASESGVNAIKSQKRDTRTLLSEEEYDMPYDSPNSFGPTYGKHRDALELNVDEHVELMEYADSLGVTYFVSPWDPVSAKQMIEIGMPMLKIASASITDEETVRVIVESDLPIIMSTGMSDEEEIENCANWVSESSGAKVMLHCTSTYPSDFDQLNLSYMRVLSENYPDFIIGFSGHHRGIAIDVGAVAMGANVIERHFTLDRNLPGSDHAASLEGPGLQKLVRDIRAFERSVGDGIKVVYEGEVPMRKKLRRVQ